jgi:hypothetical protein
MTSYQPALAEINEWAQELEALQTWIVPRFACTETLLRALVYLKGLLSSVEHKNG